MATYIIGDVQGCYDELILLLKKINFNKKRDKLVFAGDIINKGPKSLETINFIMSLKGSACIVLGNHEILFLAISYGCIQANSKHTLTDILNAPNIKDIQTWLCKQKLLIEINENIITHAGIPHIWSPKQAKKNASEVEYILRNKTTRLQLLTNIFNKDTISWSKNLVGVDRWVCILNYLTRMRTISLDGTLNIKYNSCPDKNIVDFKPWYKLRHKKLSYYTTIIFGHWSALKGITNNTKAIALDTGCVFGNKLTCYSLEDKELYSVNSIKKYRSI